MLLKTIVFDKSSPNWEKSRECNIMFLHYTLDYINGVIKNRGYMYLNQICELLGTEWNPDWDNPCVRHENKEIVSFVTDAEVENSYTVRILTIEQF